MAERPPVEVRVVVLGRSVLRLRCESGTSLEALLTAAGIEPRGRDVHVNGRPRPLDAAVEDADLVTVIPRIRGG